MTKRIILATILAFGITGCGLDSLIDSSSAIDTARENLDQINTGGSGSGGTSQPSTCSVDGNVILGITGSSCTYSGHTLACSDTGAVTLDGTFSTNPGQSVDVQGISYTCP